MELPKFDGSDFEAFLKKFSRWLRLTQVEYSDERTKLDWLVAASIGKSAIIVENLADDATTLIEALDRMATVFPKIENDLSVRQQLEKLPFLQYAPEPQMAAHFFLIFEELISHLSNGAMSDQEKFLLLVRKVHFRTWAEIRADRYYRSRSEDYASLKATLTEKFSEDYTEKHLLPKQPHKAHGLQTLQDPDPKRPKGDHQPTPNFEPSQSSNLGPPQLKGKGGKGNYQPENRFGVTILCKHCGKKGHYESRCFTKFPHLRPESGKGKSKGKGTHTPPCTQGEARVKARVHPVHPPLQCPCKQTMKIQKNARQSWYCCKFPNPRS